MAGNTVSIPETEAPRRRLSVLCLGIEREDGMTKDVLRPCISSHGSGQEQETTKDDHGSGQEQETTKDKDDGTFHWNTFIVPFLNGEVLLDMLCGKSETYISTFRKSMEAGGIKKWKEYYFPLIRRSRVKHGWSFGVSEEVISKALKPRKWSCSWIWKYENEELCVLCRCQLGNHNHEKLCRDQIHDHVNLCCMCHRRYHDDLEPCPLCGEQFYDQQENCAVVMQIECGHEFHHHCIKAHLQKKNICPVCKIKAVIPDFVGRYAQYAVPFV